MKKYDKATKTVNEALAKLDSKTFKSKRLFRKQKREVASYYAEAYHVKAFRIDFERKI